jgi:hypothetical protein
MKFKTVAVIVTAAGMSLAAAGSASALPLKHPKHKPAPPPQVSGSRLQSALLPSSAYGDGFVTLNSLNSGNKLWSTHATLHVPGMGCATFEGARYVGGFGNTAGATDFVDNPNPAIADYPSLILTAEQDVVQFGTTGAAASFYSQAFAKYEQCSDFTVPDPVFDSTDELSTQSFTKTTISKNQAFEVLQLESLSALPALSFYVNTTVVLAGTNVYTIDETNGVNDPVSPSLLSTLINRVQKLYPHHK